MFRVRPAYVPPIFVSDRRFTAVRVGDEASDAIAIAGFEASLKNGYPLAFVGEEAATTRTSWSAGRVAGALYLAPFLAGPPAVGYLLFGTIGAVAGAFLAAPAVYMFVASLLSGQPMSP